MKTLKVFVSSLFNEMMLERDILHRQVSALIAERLGKNDDITVLFVDLRWGIDSRSKEIGFEKSDYILEKCFEAIEDCDLFLGIIAFEYGSIANQEVVRKYFDDDIGAESYTSLEIKYASRHIPPEKMFFMMTEQSPEDHPATIELKKRVSENYKTCYYHKGVVEGSPFVSNQFISGIAEMVCVAAKLHKCGEKSSSGQWFTRKHAIESCMSAIGEKNIVLLTGDSGCGKSVILQMVYEELSKQGMRMFCSSAFFGGEVQALNLTKDLREWTGQNTTLERMLKTFQGVISESEYPCVIFLDSIDDMDTAEFFVLYSKLVQLPPEKVTLFLATSSPEKIAYLKGLDIERIDVARLEDDELIPYMKYIASQYNKQLFDEVCLAIELRGETIHNAFYLSVLTQQLVLMTAFDYNQAHKGKIYLDELIQQMISVVNTLPDTIDEIILWKLRDMDQYVTSEFSTFIFELMSVYQLPVPLSTAREIYVDLHDKEWGDMDYYMYRYYLRGFVVENDGHLSFTHNIMRRCVYLSYPRIHLEKYLNGILDCLLKIGGDKVALYMAAGKIRHEVLLDALKEGRDIEDINTAVSFLFYENLPYIKSNDLTSFGELFQHINEICGTQVTIDLLIQLVSYTNLKDYVERGVYFYIKAFEMVNRPETNSLSLMKLIKTLAGAIHDWGAERLSLPIINGYFKLVFQGERLAWFIKSMFDEIEMTTHYIYRLLLALDYLDVAEHLQQFVIGFMKQSTRLRVFYPSVIQDLTKKSLDKAYWFSQFLLDRFNNVEKPDEKAIYGNLLYAHMGLQAMRQELDGVDETVQQMYPLMCELYEEDNLNENYVYNYSLALSALIMTSNIRKDVNASASVYRELITLRIHLCKLYPSVYLYLNALTNTVVQVVINEQEIGMDHMELLETVYQYTADMARRGNPQACWSISSMFKAGNKNNKIYIFFINKLTEIETFLTPIMEINKGKKKLAKEIVYTYLQIYNEYCDMQILPLKNGHHLLSQLYLFAKDEVSEAEPDVDLSIMLFKVFQQLMAILLNELPQAEDVLSILENSEYKDFREFAEKQYTKRPCPETAFLVAGAESADVLFYVSMFLKVQSRDTKHILLFMMVLKEVGIDIEKTVIEHCDKAISLFEMIAKNNIQVPTDSLMLPFTGVAFLEDAFKKSKNNQQVGELKKRLLDMMPEEVRVQLMGS